MRNSTSAPPASFAAGLSHSAGRLAAHGSVRLFQSGSVQRGDTDRCKLLDPGCCAWRPSSGLGDLGRGLLPSSRRGLCGPSALLPQQFPVGMEPPEGYSCPNRESS